MARYVDAEKFAKEILRAWKLWEKKGEDCFLFSDVITPMLVSQPTADVRENVHGEWVLEHSSQLWECTNCHEREIRTTDFCPNCGADMRGEEHE